MNDRYVTDTMALVLRLEQRTLGSRGKTIFGEAEKGNLQLVVPVMVLAEIGYLSEKKRIETSLPEFKKYQRQYSTIHIAAITEEVIDKPFQINDIPELHDRMIAATASLTNSELITNDRMMQESTSISTIW